MKKSLQLIAAMMVALVAWGSGLPAWEDAMLTTNFFPALGIIGGVILAWLGQSPLKVK